MILKVACKIHLWDDFKLQAFPVNRIFHLWDDFNDLFLFISGMILKVVISNHPIDEFHM